MNWTGLDWRPQEDSRSWSCIGDEPLQSVTHSVLSQSVQSVQSYGRYVSVLLSSIRTVWKKDAKCKEGFNMGIIWRGSPRG